MDYKNVLLHTYADRWVNGKEEAGGKAPKTYDNLLNFNKIESQFLKNVNNPIPERLANQQKRLEKAEEKFYNKIFPNKNIKDFPTFIKELNDKIGGIRPYLQKLSNYNTINSLYRDILNDIEITDDFTTGGYTKSFVDAKTGKGKTARQIKEEVAFVKAGTKILISYNIDGEKASWDISEMLDSMIKTHKRKTEQNFVSLLELEEIFLPQIIKELPGEIGKPDNPFTLSQIIGQMSKHFINSFNQSFNGKVSKEVLKIYNNQVMQLTGQRSLLGRGKHKDKVKTIIYRYLTEGSAAVEGFEEAFNKAWSKIGESIIANLKLNEKGGIKNNKFTGDMGELSNLIMAYYISPNETLPIEWTGQNKNKHGEDARADIFFAGMGIQVKNFKQKNMDSSVVVKLHPSQLLDRLSEAGMSKTGQEEMAEIMANLSFNKNFRDGYYEGYIEKFKEVAKHYTSAFLNFSFNLTEFENFQDTVNFWQVGNIIVPSSAILAAYIASCSETEIKNFTTTFKFPKPELDDEEFHKSKDGHHPPFTNYWGYSGDGGWRVRKNAQNEEIENLLFAKKATIHTKFKFNKATFGDILSQNAYLFIT